MRYSNKDKPDAILVGDIHYRDSQPACRLDDFWETQKRKALWLRVLWEELDRPLVLQPGDLFHHWKSSPRVISAVLEYLPPMITIPGNPGKHNYQTQEGFERDALYTVKVSGKDGWVVLEKELVYPSRIGRKLAFTPDVTSWMWERDSDKPVVTDVLMCHRMIVDGSFPYYIDGEHGLDFLKRVCGVPGNNVRLILTGHNHKPMVFTHDGRLLLNPGSFTRQTADETHEPRVYLWYKQDKEIKSIYVPIEENVITREHIDSVKIPDQRIVAFVESLVENKIDATVRFVDNMKRYIEDPRVKERVKARLLEVIDEG